jgi:hypothetical protein
MNFAVHGYAGYFLLSLLDKYYREDQGVEDGIKLLRCVQKKKERGKKRKLLILCCVGCASQSSKQGSL